MRSSKRACATWVPTSSANPDALQRLAGLVRIIDANGAALAQVRANEDDQRRGALGLAQNFDASALPCFGDALLALAGGAHLYECESSFVRLDGAARQNELSLLVMPGHADSLDFVMVSSLDITERKRMNAELLQLATTDFLTGLPNRRHFMAALENEHARLQRELASCASVLMLDIDHFKRVNDEYGHAVGDAVLRHLGALMCQALRKVDVPGRVGGEEFAILLPGTDLAAAAVFAERLAPARGGKFADHRWRHPDHHHGEHRHGRHGRHRCRLRRRAGARRRGAVPGQAGRAQPHRTE